jgi:hypothetical protein
VALAVCAACGDDRATEQRIDAVSGTRMKLELYLYEDGTRQVSPLPFYDTRLHDECSPAQWIDGVQRCVPNVSDAVFADASCTIPIGFAPAKDMRPPTHFIGLEQVEGQTNPVLAHLYPVSGKIASAEQFYSRNGDTCFGPLTPPSDLATYGLNSELAPQAMQQVVDTEVGTGRIALRARTTPDGLFAPWSVYDRELDTACTPTVRASGVVCEPAADDVNAFADPSCTQPAVVSTSNVPHASYARLPDAGGCPQFAPLGDPITTAYYVSGNSCYPFTVGGNQQAYAVGATVEPAALTRSVENVAGHRLQHEIFGSPDDPDMRFVGDKLYDLATRSECLLALDGDLQRCLPTPLPLAITLYGMGCATTVKVVLVPQQACVDSSFATSFSDTGATTIHAIGDVVTDPLYQFTGFGGCVPYVPPAGIEPHAIGPEITADHFATAFLYGAR